MSTFSRFLIAITLITLIVIALVSYTAPRLFAKPSQETPHPLLAQLSQHSLHCLQQNKLLSCAPEGSSDPFLQCFIQNHESLHSCTLPAHYAFACQHQEEQTISCVTSSGSVVLRFRCPQANGVFSCSYLGEVPKTEKARPIAYGARLEMLF